MREKQDRLQLLRDLPYSTIRLENHYQLWQAEIKGLQGFLNYVQSVKASQKKIDESWGSLRGVKTQQEKIDKSWKSPKGKEGILL